MFAAACGSTDPAGSSLSTPLPAASSVGGDSPQPTPAADDELPPGSPPPTTTPLSIPPLSCTESIVTIAERVLIERRQRTPVSSCVAVDALPPDAPLAPPCWDRCADGRMFSDFVLDTDGHATENATESGLSVRYVARYVDKDGVESTVAETFSFQPAGDERQGMQLSGVTSTDLSSQEAALLGLLDGYFAALERNDFTSAAVILVGSSSVPSEERPDLGRFVDEGLLADGWTGDGADGQVADVASAIGAWCRDGALCRAPDRLRAEVTPQHTIRAVATYEVDGRSFDTVFTPSANGESVIGLPPNP
jgi:hypothetical protein